MSAPAGLANLERTVARDLAAIEIPPQAWLPAKRRADGEIVRDVVVVGAGLSGLTIGFGLLRNRIDNFTIIDQADAGREGPWITTARMATLRSPKELTGPDLGLPSLTFRSWFEALHGTEAFERLVKIAPADWMAYLAWYRAVLGLPVQNNVRLLGIEDSGDGVLALAVETADSARTLHARRVVLATGIEGSGRPRIPEMVRALPADRYTHSASGVDPAIFAGRDIAVLGAGASAFDWATTALDNGAASATLFARRGELPKTEVLAWTNFPGFLGGFAELDDARRWRFMRRIFALQAPPTQEMFNRAMCHPRFRLELGAPWRNVRMDGDRVLVATERSSRHFDHVLLGTGFETDLAARPELAAFAGNIALWRDRYTPPEGEADPELGAHPYLGPAFELTERAPGSAPALCRIHVFNNGALLSSGPVCNGITGLKYGAPKIVAGIARSLFLEDADDHLDRLMRYDEAHFRATPDVL